MRKVINGTLQLLWLAVAVCCASCYLFVRNELRYLAVLIPAFLLLNLLPGAVGGLKGFRLRLCRHGAVMLWIFLVSAVLSAAWQIVLILYKLPRLELLFSILVCVLVEAVIFWNGIICVYLTSTQLGLKTRILGVVFGMIPIANVVMLCVILKKVTAELRLERDRQQLDESRKEERICATRYPILLVHGVFFRDNRIFNYWGRIPGALEKNGAKLYYGEHQSAASVAESAEELTYRIRWLVEKTGCEKVNVIAHSKGGLDCRYAMAHLGAEKWIASLTTVNTPHRGCLFAEDLLEKIPEKVQHKVADTYDKALRRLGDPDPSFMAAVEDLTASVCVVRDRLPVPDGVYAQSVGSVMGKASSGAFPLNLSYRLVRHYDGENDGLVAESAFAWGEKYTLVRPAGRQGISHGDIIDLGRKDIPGFDVREFYVQLVAELKKRGL